MAFSRIGIALLALSILLAQPQTQITLITGAQVADGTGGPLRLADVRIQGDRIVAIGQLKPDSGDKIIDARGLVLAPGFVDIHNHSSDGLTKDPAAESQVSQGITTVILGPDGGSPWPIGEYLEQRRQHPAAAIDRNRKGLGERRDGLGEQQAHGSLSGTSR